MAGLCRRRDALNIAFAMAQIQAHLVFGNTFLYAQLSNPISYKELIHHAPTFRVFYYTQRKTVIITTRLPIYAAFCRYNRYIKSTRLAELLKPIIHPRLSLLKLNFSKERLGSGPGSRTIAALTGMVGNSSG